ncbi:SRPBCC family protein [Gordonia sp. NPDC003429]
MEASAQGDGLVQGDQEVVCRSARRLRGVDGWWWPVGARSATKYEEPTRIALSGHGRGAVRITLTMTVTPHGSGSHFHLDAHIGGGVLNGPIGHFVARVIKSDAYESIENLAELR